MFIVFRKELADYFTSVRCFILFLLVIFASAASLYAGYEGMSSVNTGGLVFLKLFITPGEVVPFSFTTLLNILVPIIGITLGFDAINSERSGGTISRLLSQPVFRDSVINGKFLAGMVTISIMVGSMVLIVAGYGLSMIGVIPIAEEVFRLLVYAIFAIVLGSFWMGLAMLFSVVARKISASLLASIGVWLFFSFFILMIATAIAGAIAPVDASNPDLAALIRNEEVTSIITRFSPNQLFTEASSALLAPEIRSFGYWTVVSQSTHMLPNPLSLGQSAVLIWPQLTALLSLTLVCFAVSYVIFMRQEIRAT